jgi:predicted amidohydrolase YtcJ
LSPHYSGLARWALILVPLVLSTTACVDDRYPQLIVHHANVLTMDPSGPTATAFAVTDGRFVEVGEDDRLREMAGPDTHILDLAGLTVVPGFNDAHLHPLFMPANGIDLGESRTPEDIVATLRQSPSMGLPGQWIFGFGYDDTVLGRHLDRADLDRVSTTQPVMAWHGSLHLFVVNSYLLDNAGIDANTPDPEDGQYFRDDEGGITGLLGERSALESLLVGAIESPLPNNLESALGILEAFVDVAHRNGITSIGDALVPPELAFAYWYFDPEEHGIRVNLMWDAEALEIVRPITRSLSWLSAMGVHPLSNEWLRADTVKFFHGLSLSGRTARLHDAYADRPDYFGLEPQRSQEDLDALVAEIHERGLQVAVHSNGDFEIDMVLDAIDRANRASPREHRHRIEHGSVVSERILERMSELRIVLAPHSYLYEKGPMTEAYGADRWPLMFPNASTFEYGVPNAGNSDYPVSGLSPLLRIQSLVTRTSRAGKTYGADQRLSVEQALYVYTMGGAFATFEEDSKGSISPGKFADFVILSADPREVASSRIKDIEVLATWVGGVNRFERGRVD